MSNTISLWRSINLSSLQILKYFCYSACFCTALQDINKCVLYVCERACICTCMCVFVCMWVCACLFVCLWWMNAVQCRGIEFTLNWEKEKEREIWRRGNISTSKIEIKWFQNGVTYMQFCNMVGQNFEFCTSGESEREME